MTLVRSLYKTKLNPPLTNKKQKEKKKAISVQVEKSIKTGGE
jgi:hypothetical protein